MGRESTIVSPLVFKWKHKEKIKQGMNSCCILPLISLKSITWCLSVFYNHCCYWNEQELWLCTWYQGRDKHSRWRLILWLNCRWRLTLWLTCNTQIILSDHWGVIIPLVLETCQIRGKICSQWNSTKYFTGFCVWAWLHGACSSRCTNGCNHAAFVYCNFFLPLLSYLVQKWSAGLPSATI